MYKHNLNKTKKHPRGCFFIFYSEIELCNNGSAIPRKIEDRYSVLIAGCSCGGRVVNDLDNEIALYNGIKLPNEGVSGLLGYAVVVKIVGSNYLAVLNNVNGNVYTVLIGEGMTVVEGKLGDTAGKSSGGKLTYCIFVTVKSDCLGGITCTDKLERGVSIT